VAAKQEAEGATLGKPELAPEARCFSAESIHSQLANEGEQEAFRKILEVLD
jgi:hypothetical protein